jgi:phage terminase large subunit
MSTDVEVSKVFTKIRKAPTRVIVNEGSARSTKTYSICQYLIMRCVDLPAPAVRLKLTIARKKLTWLKATAMVDFYDILKNNFHLYNPDNENKTDCTYNLNGCEVAFIGLDEAQKVHGRKQDIVWINEAIEMDEAEYTQLAIRTVDKIILDYNPSMEQHWIYDKVIPRDDCTFIKSTYKDNSFLAPAIKAEIERLEPTPENIKQGTADETSWKIYGLGERAAHKGLIFTKVDIVKDLPPKSEWKKHFYGQDFGFTNDPSVLVQIVLAHGELYFDQIFYERGLTNIKNAENPGQKSIQQRYEEKQIEKNVHIWADKAEPKSIQDLAGCGYHINGADKGPDSIKAGIDLMLRYKCHLTERSIDAIKEKNNYKWKIDSSGNPTNDPIDLWNHFWDATRYGCFMELRNAIPDMSLVSLTGQSKWLNRDNY